MEDLKKRVESCQSAWNVAPTYRLDYYKSSVGQNYAILVTKGLWYCVRLFVEDEHPNCCERFVVLAEDGKKSRVEQLDLEESSHTTLEGVENQIKNIRNFFKNPRFSKMALGPPFNFPSCHICEVPMDYQTNPHKYLKRGDIIATPFKMVASHTGIYLGKGQVCHVSGHGGKKKADSVARIGTLIGDFVSEGANKIWIVCLPLRIRPREEIAAKAEELAANKFREGEYDVLSKNCQHFVLLCAAGVEDTIESASEVTKQ